MQGVFTPLLRVNCGHYRHLQGRNVNSISNAGDREYLYPFSRFNGIFVRINFFFLLDEIVTQIKNHFLSPTNFRHHLFEY
jgi:hypothetical protein